MNVRSIRNKTLYINDYITTHNIDIFAVSETWFDTDTDDICINELLPNNYEIKHVNRSNDKRAGGVALIYSTSLKIVQHTITTQYTQFEVMSVLISNRNKNINMCIIYRPPTSTTNGLSLREFMDEWQQFISTLTISNSELLLVGDVNIHLDKTDNSDTKQFTESMRSCGLHQHITEPTHVAGHTLDVLITRDKTAAKFINDIEVRDIGLCTNKGILVRDHYAIICSIKLEVKTSTYEMVSYRKLKAINVCIFRHDLKSIKMMDVSNNTIDTTCITLHNLLTNVVDKHAPLIQRLIYLRPNTPWYTEELRSDKRERRRLERAWRKDKNETSLKDYHNQCVKVARNLYHTKTDYYSNKVKDCENDPKKLNQITHKLLNDEKQKLPSHTTDEQLADDFADYFHIKIDTIRGTLRIDTSTIDEHKYLHTLSQFRPTNEDEIAFIIKQMPSKSCELDPLPTWLMKQCIEELLPITTSIINTSLRNGIFPHTFKQAIIRPLLKKPTLDTENLKNYRPVSNLSFLSKLLEKVVAVRIEEHIDVNNLSDVLQSAYKRCHSTETALLKLKNDIVSTLDNNQTVVLVSLDLSAAFDTVDHSILLQRLTNLYGFTDKAIQWMESYLRHRTYRVYINKSCSKVKTMQCGVPQGSVLGARLYTMYTYNLSNIIKKHNLKYHSYADDTQIYMICDDSVTARQQAIQRIQMCVEEICEWMSLNSLKLNEEKTELIVFSRHTISPSITMKIGSANVTASQSVRVLGVELDSAISMNMHISQSCRSANVQLRKISRIRKYLTVSAVKTLVQATVASKMDYCNSLYVGLPLMSFKRLQLTQNTAARIITRKSKYDHISGELRRLHWLPLSIRCQFKLLTLIYKMLKTTAPTYLRECVDWYVPARTLRSASVPALVPRRHRTITYGRRTLDTAAASLWNALPPDIRRLPSLMQFRRSLKTYLFSQ